MHEGRTSSLHNRWTSKVAGLNPTLNCFFTDISCSAVLRSNKCLMCRRGGGGGLPVLPVVGGWEGDVRRIYLDRAPPDTHPHTKTPHHHPPIKKQERTGASPDLLPGRCASSWTIWLVWCRCSRPEKFN